MTTRLWRYGLMASGSGLLTFALFPVPFIAGLSIVSGAFACVLQIAVIAVATTAVLLPPIRPAPRSPSADDPADAFLSVHVPSHNEPPEVLIATLNALAAQRDAPAFEVIVIDNNTTDRACWRPVARWCAARRRQSPRIRFIHRLGVKGAKAGALNIALAASDRRATHVVIVDADYRATPDFLRTAAAAILDGGADFVQFPQAYHLPGNRGEGVAFELGDYFSRHARAANQAAAMLLTGTLSVIRREALVAVGGWSDRTVTEDAELGLRLNRAGYRGFYDDRVMACGMLPLGFSSLESQRHRWTSGNMRTLVCGLGRKAPVDDYRLRGGFSHMVLAAAQLTAWTNFALPAALSLGLAAIMIAQGSGALAHIAALLALVTLLLALSGAILPLALEAIRGRESLATAFVAIATRTSLLPTAAIATIAGLLPLRQSFRKTDKKLGARITAMRPLAPMLLATGGMGCALMVAGHQLSEWPLMLSGMLMFLPVGAAPICARDLRRYGAALRAETTSITHPEGPR